MAEEYNPKLISTLTDEFNVINYGADYTSTNIIFDDKKNELVIRFDCDQSSAQRYLSMMREEIVISYFGKNENTSKLFDMKHFPFGFTQGRFRRNNGMLEFVTPMNDQVLMNLKKYSAHGIVRSIKTIMKQQVREGLKHDKGFEETVARKMADSLVDSVYTIVLEETSPHLIGISFGESYHMKLMFNAKIFDLMKDFGLDMKDYWVQVDDELFLKNNNNPEFYQNVATLTKERIGHAFEDPSTEDEKVQNYKNTLADLIYSTTGVTIDNFIRDEFLDKNEGYIDLIPTVGPGDNTRYLTSEEAKKINKAFKYLGCGDVISNIEGKTKLTEGKENGGTYGISNKQLANLIQTFIRNSFVTTSGRFEIDPSLTHEQKLGCMPLKRPRVSSVNSAQQDFNKKSHLSPFKENNDHTSIRSSRNTVSSDSQIAGEEEILTTSCEEDIAQQNNVHEQLYTTSEETYMENIPPNTVTKNNTNQKSLEKKTNGEIHTTSPLNQDDNKENSVSAMTSGKKKFSKKNTDKVGNTSKEQKPQASFVKEPQVSNLVQEKQKKKGFLSRIASYFR